MAKKIEDLWESQYLSILQQHKNSKLTNIIWLELENRYKSLDKHEKKIIDKVLSSWLISENYIMRCDAIYLVKKFNIHSTIPALKNLHKRLSSIITASSTSRHHKAVTRNECDDIQDILQKFENNTEKEI